LVVYGYLAEIALVHGLSPGAHSAVVKILALTLASMVVVMILQNRQAVEDWIRSWVVPQAPDRDPNQQELPGLEQTAPTDAEAQDVNQETIGAEAGASDTGSTEEASSAPPSTPANTPVQPAVTSSERSSESLRLRGAKLLVSWFADLWHVLAIIYIAAIYLVWALQVPGGFALMASGTVQTIVLIAIGFLLMRVTAKMITKAFAIPDDIAERMPGLERRANRYLPVIKTTANILIWGSVFIGVLDAWGLAAAAWLASAGGLSLLGSLVSLVIIAAIALGLWELVGGAIERKLTGLEASTTDLERVARLRTLLPLVKTIFTVVLIVIVTLIVLAEIGVNIGPLLAGAGIIGVAVGFGSQKLVQDIITGLFILIEDQVSVGDVVDTGSHSGVVEAINLRTIRLRDLSGTVHIVPFSDVSSIKNLTKDFAFAVMDVGVAYREDVDEVIVLLERCGAELQQDEEHGPNILEPITIFGVNEFADSAVIIRCRLKTKPMMQWGVKRAFNRIMKRMFDEHGIEIPFPHQTIYFGELKDGSAPPAYVVRAKGRPADGAGDSIEMVTEDEKQAALANLSNRPVDGDEV
ncbi:MAG: mechanosensitive ion channel domain-containing protein, partial [Pseudomonadota bacterium]